jgi:replicative DNA helicase
MQVAANNSQARLNSVKTPPHSIEAERSVLGAILLDPHAWDKIVSIIYENDFYVEAHRKIFSAIVKLAMKSQPCDALTLAEALKQAGDLDFVGGDAVVFELANATPSAAHVITYAEIVRDKSLLRQLMSAGNNFN